MVQSSREPLFRWLRFNLILGLFTQKLHTTTFGPLTQLMTRIDIFYVTY